MKTEAEKNEYFQNLKKKIQENTIQLCEVKNEKQKGIIESLLERIPQQCKMSEELKELEIVKTGKKLSVSMIHGAKHDEGTFLQSRRERRNFWIGSRGGLKSLNKNYKLVSVKYWNVLHNIIK